MRLSFIRYCIAALFCLLLISCPTHDNIEDEPYSLGISMCEIPGGSFQRDANVTNISIVNPFFISTTEITRTQFNTIMFEDPSLVSASSGLDDPVQCVNWYQAITFCNKLSIAEGLNPVYSIVGVNFITLEYDDIPIIDSTQWNEVSAIWSNNGYRLPTEMEWIWVAMDADHQNPGSLNSIGYQKPFAGSDGVNLIGDFAVFGFGTGTSGATTTPRTSIVGSKYPTVLGTCDLSGNVREWLWDWYDVYPSGTLNNYKGPLTGEKRLWSGGSWSSTAASCAVNFRSYNFPNSKYDYGGFRVVRKK